MLWADNCQKHFQGRYTCTNPWNHHYTTHYTSSNIDHWSACNKHTFTHTHEHPHTRTHTLGHIHNTNRHIVWTSVGAQSDIAAYPCHHKAHGAIWTHVQLIPGSIARNICCQNSCLKVASKCKVVSLVALLRLSKPYMIKEQVTLCYNYNKLWDIKRTTISSKQLKPNNHTFTARSTYPAKHTMVRCVVALLCFQYLRLLWKRMRYVACPTLRKHWNLETWMWNAWRIKNQIPHKQSKRCCWWNGPHTCARTCCCVRQHTKKSKQWLCTFLTSLRWMDNSCNLIDTPSCQMDATLCNFSRFAWRPGPMITHNH